MADETDQNEKTEEPTSKKIEDARQKGNLPNSREVNHWFMILAAAIAVMVLVPDLFRRLGRVLPVFIEATVEPLGEGGAFFQLIRDVITEVALAMLPLMLLLVVAALASGLIQNGFVFSTESIQPKLDKLSIAKGIKRLFSVRSLVEFTKGIVKIVIVGTVMLMVLIPKLDEIGLTPTYTMVQVLELLQSLTARMLIAVLSVMTVIMVVDVLYSRFEHTKKLRMSRQEIKEEMKQTEGDPHVKARLRQIRMERARRRMMSKVPEADVVITNPTHYAIALKYNPETMPAPLLIAKGTDAVAARIREVAEEHGIPLVRNPPLAQALFATVGLDEEVPPDHYRAVAEVISYVMGLKK